MKKNISLTAFIFLTIQFIYAQNTGVGTINPLHKLHVASGTGNNLMLENSNVLDLGTTNSITFTNSVNAVTFYKYAGAIRSIGTSPTSARLGFFTKANNAIFGLVERLTILDNGFIGIGTVNPQHTLDVNGIINCNTAIDCQELNATDNVTANTLNVNSNAAVNGNLTVSGNKGVIRNAAGSGQLRYYTRQAAFTAILPAFGTSPEGSIGFSGFTGTPQVFVGDIVSTGGTVGELFRVQLVIYDVTPTGCHCRLINTSNGPVNYNITWNIICIGN